MQMLQISMDNLRKSNDFGKTWENVLHASEPCKKKKFEQTIQIHAVCYIICCVSIPFVSLAQNEVVFAAILEYPKRLLFP